MDFNKITFLMMLCVPMFVGAQTLTFTDHESMADLNALKEQTWRTASFWHISYLENAGATNKLYDCGRCSR